MPFTGGASPSPERTGGGEGLHSSTPLVQRIYETIARARGSAYDQSWPPTTAVGIENLAYARVLALDGWGFNARLANECNPAKASAGGLLPRWERILGQPPLPGDTEPVRRARCAAAMARFGVGSLEQAVVDVLTSTLGPLFVALVHYDPTNALIWWPGITGTNTATIAGIAGNIVTIAGLARVPSNAQGALFEVAGFTHPSNNGAFVVKTWLSPSSVTIVNNGGPVSPDAATGVWSVTNPGAPWTSTIAHLGVEVTQTPAGYHNADGSPNALFYQTVGQVGAVLDQMLGAHMTFTWFVTGIGGALGFLLDQPNIDLLAFST